MHDKRVLVPKLRLGTPLWAKLCFAWRGCLRARSRWACGQRADTPAWETEFPSQVRSQTEFGNEALLLRPQLNPVRDHIAVGARVCERDRNRAIFCERELSE